MVMGASSGVAVVAWRHGPWLERGYEKPLPRIPPLPPLVGKGPPLVPSHVGEGGEPAVHPVGGGDLGVYLDHSWSPLKLAFPFDSFSLFVGAPQKNTSTQ